MRDYEHEAKFDEKVEEVLKSRDLDAFKTLFPSVKKMVLYSNKTPPYPHKKDSVLAILAKIGDKKFFNELWDEYFPLDDHLSYIYGPDFLKGTTSLGETINYHYFKDSLSAKEKCDAEIFCSGSKTAKKILINKRKEITVDSRTREQKKRAEFYYNLRDKYASIGGNDAADMFRDIELRGDDLVENIKGKDFVLRRDFKKIARVELHHVPTKNNTLDYVSVVNDLDISIGADNLSKQVFNKLDFPDLFFNLRYEDFLARLADAYAVLPKAEVHKDLYRFSSINNHTLVIENDNSVEHRDVSENAYAIYCHDTKKTYLNARLIEDDDDDLLITISHENTHGFDFSHNTMTLSDNLINPAMTWFCIEKELNVKHNSKIAEIVSSAMGYKGSFKFPIEMLPRLMAEGYGDDKLAESAVKLVNLLNQYENKGYKALVNRYEMFGHDNIFAAMADSYLSEKDKPAAEDINLYSAETTLSDLISEKSFAVVKEAIISKYGKFDVDFIREEIAANIDAAYGEMKEYEKAFGGNENLKKLDIGRKLYALEPSILSKGALEDFYYETAAKPYGFYSSDGRFNLSRFYAEFSAQMLKIEKENKPKEKTREILRTYILLNETGKSVGFKPDKRINFEKINMSFESRKDIGRHVQNLNRGMQSLYDDIRERNLSASAANNVLYIGKKAASR
ncbi:MAG: hypothetical protein LBR70_01740 [Lactobacillaceae bacterium]|jgi:hypothetical protein|nr:hypothetical protein [Lactobacillaceae bacterium]